MKKNNTKQIVDLFLEHNSTRLVADKLGIHLETVRRHLKEAGVDTPRKGRRHNPYTRCDQNAELVLEMSRSGESLAEIGRTVGTKGVEVKKFLERNGIVKEYTSAVCGEKHYLWRGWTVDKDGYVLIHKKGHPNARKHTHYIFEHRLVMEEALQRFLLPEEVVHHKDGNKKNNKIENLQLFASNGEHLAVDLKGRCPNWSPEGKERIRKAVRQPRPRKHASTHAPSKTCAELSP